MRFDMKPSRLLFTALLFVPILAIAQDIVAIEGVRTSLQKSNRGRIFFTARFVPSLELKTRDFQSSCTLSPKSDLFFVAFFDNSLTNYLHRLAPGLAADSLVKIGNYQFTLLVDGRLIYQSNLWPGAPNAKFQDTATMLNRALIDNENGTGSWSESFWNRFLSNGGDSALTDGKHILRMEIRPYIKTGTLRVGELMASGDLNLNVIRTPRIDISKISLNKVRPYDGFTVSGEAFDRNKIKALKANIEEGVFKKISSIVVISKGKLLIEEYFNGANRKTLHDVRSVGKSFSSTLTGLAIRDGYIKSEEQTLESFYKLGSYANFSTAKEQTTLKELLTMSSGFDGNDEDYRSPGTEDNMYGTPDWVKFALDLPFRASGPAGKWHYFTAGVVLLGDIINRQVKGGLEKYADENLFRPLNITRYKWQYTPQHIPNTAGGIQMNALDFAKYGQLYKSGGVWNRKQIIPKDWIAKTFTRQKKIEDRTNEFYGYLFWNKSFMVNGRSYEAFYCAGNGGNYILIFKDLPLVVVITATAYGQPYAHTQVTKMLSEFILPALIK